MTNNNITASVPIAGKGFAAKLNGNFEPGEYRALTNVEVDENIIKSRRSIRSIYGDAPDINATPITNNLGFIGNLNDYVLAVNEDEQIAFKKNSRVPMWSPSLLIVAAAAGSFHKLIGYFRYNVTNYWLSLDYNSASSIKIKAQKGDVDIISDDPVSYDATYFATLTSHDLVSIPNTDFDYNKFQFKNFFIQKERLWIATSIGLYFSKATDPTLFDVSDGGGFFKFPDSKINHVLAIKDMIYVFCDNSIYSLTYNTDPNLDASVVKIAEIGGDSAAVYQDTPIFINQVGVYQVTNSYVEKLFDNEFDLGEDFYKHDIAVFDNYLIINKYQDLNYEKNDYIVSSRTNRHTNPALGVSMANFSAPDSFMNRERLVHPITGEWAIKCTKRNDLTLVSRENLIPNPYFYNDLSHTARGSDPTGAGVHTRVYDVYKGYCYQVKIVTGALSAYQPFYWEYDFVPVVAGHSYNTTFAKKIEKALPVGSYVKHYVTWYDAGFTPVGYSAGDTLFTSASVINTWSDQQVTNVAPVGAVWAKVSFNRVNKFTDNTIVKISKVLFEDQTVYGLNTYMDGYTADVGTEYNYEWVGTAGSSASVRKGHPGTGDDLKILSDFSGYINVLPDSNYTITFDAYSTLSRYMDIVVSQYDSLNNFIGFSVLTLNKTEGGSVKTILGTITTDPDAAKITLSYRTNSNMVFGHVYWLSRFTVELTSTYSNYFDASFVDTPVLDYTWSGTAHLSESTVTSNIFLRKEYLTGKMFKPFEANNVMKYNTYFLNMINGAVFVMGFTDYRDSENKGYITDIYVNPSKDSKGNYNCFFMTNSLVSELTSSYLFKGNVYYLSSFDDIDFVDYAVNDDDVLKRYYPEVDIEIDSFVPDGNEYLMKKFRHLLLMCKLPNMGIKLGFGYDDLDIDEDSLVLLTTPLEGRAHFPLRVPINQRAHAITIKIKNEDSDIPMNGDPLYGSFELSNLFMYWSYTRRAVETHSR